MVCWRVVKKEVNRFLDRTSFHALSILPSSTKAIAKTFWLLVFMTALVATIYFVYTIIRDYLEYPTIERLARVMPDSLVFPAVTICNINKLQKSKIPREMRENAARDYKYARQSLPVNKARKFVSAQLMSNVTLSELDTMKLPGEVMFLDYIDYACTFEEEKCSFANDFTTVYTDITNGICYTFNYDGKWKMHGSGAKHGLKLHVFLNSSDMFPYVSDYYGKGVRVFFHPPGTSPNPLNDGVLLSSGTDNTIAVSQINYERLAHPYPANCTSSEKGLLYPGAYSVGNCIETCRSKLLREKCGLNDIMKNYFLTGQKDEIVKHNYTQAQLCTNKILRENPCQCSMACFETRYSTKISSTLWPASNDDFMHAELASAINKNTSTASIEFLRDNFISVGIIYSELSYDVFKQSPKYIITGIISQIGGVMGVLNGASLISITEFIVLIACVIFKCALKGNERAKNEHDQYMQEKKDVNSKV